MSSLAIEMHALAQDVSFSEDSIIVNLVDGRAVSAPIVWFPRLFNATEEQRNDWELLGSGEGIHWKEIDEDLSVAGLLSSAH